MGDQYRSPYKFIHNHNSGFKKKRKESQYSNYQLNTTITNYINNNAVQDVTNLGPCNKHFILVTCKQVF